MQHSRNVITKQERMYNYTPLNVITKYHTPSKAKTVYIYTKEQIRNMRTNQVLEMRQTRQNRNNKKRFRLKTTTYKIVEKRAC